MIAMIALQHLSNPSYVCAAAATVDHTQTSEAGLSQQACHLAQNAKDA